MSPASDAAARDPGIPDAVAPPPNHPRFPLLDGLRAIAALSVLAFHATPYGAWGGRLLLHLNVGVTLFFLLSGFLLYRPFIAHRTGGANAPADRDYLRRRVLRIFPAYWLVLVVVLLLPGLMEVRGGDLLGQFALLQTMPFAGQDGCGEALATCSLAHTWSLAVELTFYLTLPLYVLGADRLARGRPTSSWVRTELLVLAALAGASTLAHLVVFQPDQTSLLGGTVVGFGLWFALGMGLAVVSVGIAADPGPPTAIAWIARRGAALWLAAAAAYALLAMILPPNPFLTGFDPLIAQLGFGLIALLVMLPAVFAGRTETVVARVLSNAALKWLGLISYGIFLWHVPVIYELRRGGVTGFLPTFLLTVAISVAIAATSYYVVERPALRLKDRRWRHRTASILSRP